MILRFLHLLLGLHIGLVHIPNGISRMCLSCFRTCDVFIVWYTTVLPSALLYHRDFWVRTLYGCVILTGHLLQNGLLVRSFMKTYCVPAVCVVIRGKCPYGRTRCSLSIASVGGSFGCGTSLYPDWNTCYRAPMDVRSLEILRRVSLVKAEQSHVCRRVPGSNGPIVLLRSVVALFRRVLSRSHTQAVTPSVPLMSCSRTTFTRKLVILVHPRIGRCCLVPWTCIATRAGTFLYTFGGPCF